MNQNEQHAAKSLQASTLKEGELMVKKQFTDAEMLPEFNT